MSTPFDPYRDWLGIDGGASAADYYRVFGLPHFAGDPQVIAAAADLAIARLEALDAGTRDNTKQRLIEKLAAARACLLDPAARLHYDEQLRARIDAARPPVAAAIPVQAAPTESAEDPPWGNLDRLPRRSRATRSRSSTAGTMAAIAVVCLLVLGIAGVVGWQLLGDDAAEVAIADPPPMQPTPTVERPPPEEPRQRSPAEMPPAEAPLAETLSAEPPASVSDPGTGPARQSEPPPKVVEQPAPAKPTRPAPKSTASDTKMPAAAKVTASTKPPAPADPAAAARRLAAFERGINRARAALVARNLDEAARQLDVAEKNLPAAERRAELRQLRALAAQLTRFWEAVRAGLAKYQSGEEIRIGDVVTAIVEIDRNGVKLFIEGSQRYYSIATMPARVALFFARSAADESAPPAQVFYGAFHVVDPQGDRDRARQLWRSAGALEMPVDELLPLLDGPPLGELRESPPDEQLVAAAQGQLQGRFAEQILAAKSVRQRSQLAAELLDAGRRANNSSEQYAALDEARQWAIAAGDPTMALAAIDELAQWFEADVLQLKSDALGVALAGTGSTAAAARAATAAMMLVDQAEQAGRRELASTLADTAYTAARKARDGGLIKAAYRRRQELAESGK